MTALVYVASPTDNPISFTISGLAGASADTKLAVEAAITDVFKRVSEPGGTIYLSDIEAAIAAVPLTQGFVITSPSANVAQTTGQLPSLDLPVTYT